MKAIKYIISSAIIISSFYCCKSYHSTSSILKQQNVIKSIAKDFNNDGNTDIIIISKKDDNFPITIYTSNSKGQVYQSFTNNYISNTYLELYNTIPDISLQKNKLIISYYGGMCHRESRTLIFIYEKNLKNFYFDSLTTSHHNVCNDSEGNSEVITNPKLRSISFSEFKDVLY